jgi:hypothetical protein
VGAELLIQVLNKSEKEKDKEGQIRAYLKNRSDSIELTGHEALDEKSRVVGRIRGHPLVGKTEEIVDGARCICLESDLSGNLRREPRGK